MKSFLKMFCGIMLLAAFAALPAKAASGEIAIDEASFPDETFRSYVSKNFDADGNGCLSQAEVSAATCVNVRDKAIAALDGIEYLTALEELDCTNCRLNELPLEKNWEIKQLKCGGNNLDALILDNRTALEYVDCTGCGYMPSISLRGCTGLKILKAGSNHAMPDLTGCTALEELDFSINLMNDLDISDCLSLKKLDVSYNCLMELDVSHCLSLETLYCFNNNLTSLNLLNNKNLQQLACHSNQIASLPLNALTNLQTVYCLDNGMTDMDVYGCYALKELYCAQNELTELDLSTNTNLEILHCDDNRLTSLDLGENRKLTEMTASRNSLTLSVAGNTLPLDMLPGCFDGGKASAWTGGTSDGNSIALAPSSAQVSYLYDCGNGFSVTFTLELKREGASGILGKSSDGNFYYYEGGQVATAFTGLVPNAAGSWYIKDGVAQLRYDGAVNLGGTLYYIKGGRVNESFTGIVRWDGLYYYFSQGINDTAFRGLVSCGEMLAYVQDGRVDFTASGVMEWEGNLLYVKYGIWRNDFKGLARKDDGSWIYMENGAFQPGYTGVAKLNSLWVYVTDGTVDFKFSGGVTEDGIDYNVKYGVVQFN